MMSSAKADADALAMIFSWYEKSRIDYEKLYIHTYIAFNAWYVQMSPMVTNRHAINTLQKRFLIWEDLLAGAEGNTLAMNISHIKKLLTKYYYDSALNTFRNTNVLDWQGLIDYWYQLRCQLVHGSRLSPLLVRLGYETLSIYMAEIIRRLRLHYDSGDERRLNELQALAEAGKLSLSDIGEQAALHMKYIRSPSLWQVDMTSM